MDIDHLKEEKIKVKESKGKSAARYINISKGPKEIFILNTKINSISCITINSDKVITEVGEYDLNNYIKLVNISSDYGYIISLYKKKNIVYILASDIFEIYE